MEGGLGLVWFGLVWRAPGPWSLAPVSVCTPDLRHGNAERNAVTLSYVLAPHLFGHLCYAPRTWSTAQLLRTPDAPTWSLTCSHIGGEELNYGGSLAKFHRLQCRQHVHMVYWNCRPVVCALSFLGYAHV